MSDIYFIVSTICVVVVTILLSYLLIQVIVTLDDVRSIVLKTKDVTANASKAIATVTTLGGILSPAIDAFGEMKKSKRKKSED